MARSPEQFTRSDSGFYDTRFTDPSGQGVTVDFDSSLRIAFKDYDGNTRFTATTTSAPVVQVGVDALGPFYFVSGLDLQDYAFGAVRAEAFGNVSGVPFDPFPVVEEPAFTIVADRIPLQLQRDETLHAILGRTTKDIIFVIIDPITGFKTDAESFSASLINNRDNTVATFSHPGDPRVVKRDAGIFAISFNTTTFSDQEYLMNIDVNVATGLRFVRNKVIRVVPSPYFKIGAILRNQIDKSNKLLHKRLQFGYTDAQLITWLDLGVHLINMVPPYTSFQVTSFPFAIYGKMLIDAATIAALESQGLFAIDTDYDYALGGNSLVLDHFTKISGFLDYLVGRFNENLTAFKQVFRTKGGSMVQTQYGYGFGRFLSVVPPGFFSRFGLQVGPGVGSIVSTGAFP